SGLSRPTRPVSLSADPSDMGGQAMTEITSIAPLSRRPAFVPSDVTAVAADASTTPIVATDNVVSASTQESARPLAYRVRQGIYLVSALIPGLIAMRLLLPVLGADPASGFGGF